MSSFIPPGKQTFVDPLTGDVLPFGTVEMYIPGGSTPKDTWSDRALTSLNDNPIPLNADGQCIIWGSGLYRQILRRADGSQVWDQVTGLLEPEVPMYETAGVRFDSLAAIENAALVATDSPFLSWSFWFRYDFGPYPGSYNIWIADRDVLGNNWEFDSNGGFTSTSQLLLSTEPPSFTTFMQVVTPSASLNSDWHHCLGSVSMDGSGEARIYFDGVDVTDVVTATGPGGNMAWNGLSFLIGDFLLPSTGFPANGFTGDLAQFWFAPSQSLLVDGDISPETVAKFYDAGPVDLGSDGSTPTGTAPAIYLNIGPGDSAADFLTNHGTGGNFSSVGTDDLSLSQTAPPTAGPSFPYPVIIGTPAVGEEASLSITWPRTILSTTYQWRKSGNVTTGTSSTYTFQPSDESLLYYCDVFITDALGLWPAPSNGDGTYFGPIT